MQTARSMRGDSVLKARGIQREIGLYVPHSSGDAIE